MKNSYSNLRKQLKNSPYYPQNNTRHKYIEQQNQTIVENYFKKQGDSNQNSAKLDFQRKYMQINEKILQQRIQIEEQILPTDCPPQIRILYLKFVSDHISCLATLQTQIDSFKHLYKDSIMNSQNQTSFNNYAETQVNQDQKQQQLNQKVQQLERREQQLLKENAELKRKLNLGDDDKQDEFDMQPAVELVEDQRQVEEEVKSQKQEVNEGFDDEFDQPSIQEETNNDVQQYQAVEQQLTQQVQKVQSGFDEDDGFDDEQQQTKPQIQPDRDITILGQKSQKNILDFTPQVDTYAQIQKKKHNINQLILSIDNIQVQQSLITTIEQLQNDQQLDTLERNITQILKCSLKEDQRILIFVQLCDNQDLNVDEAISTLKQAEEKDDDAGFDDAGFDENSFDNKKDQQEPEQHNNQYDAIVTETNDNNEQKQTENEDFDGGFDEDVKQDEKQQVQIQEEAQHEQANNNDFEADFD